MAADTIKRGIGKFQFLCVHPYHFDVALTALSDVYRSFRDHLIGQIDADDLAVGAGCFGGGE